MSQTETQNDYSYGHVLQSYKGYGLRWTGYKATKNQCAGKRPDDCWVCQKPIQTGDDVYENYLTDRIEHWACHGTPDYAYGQALAAFAPNTSKERYLYASYPGGEGRYRRGESFDIELQSSQTQIEVGMEQAMREGYRDAFVRLKRLIDAQPDNCRKEM